MAYDLRNTSWIAVFEYCDPTTRDVARLEKSVRKAAPLGECF